MSDFVRGEAGDGLKCRKCGRDSAVLVNGRCPHCKPFRACRRCGDGTYVSKPTPNWMNRFVCDTCGHKVSR